MKKVIVTTAFNDLEHGRELRDLYTVLILEDERSEELLGKNVVKELVEIDLTVKKEESKEEGKPQKTTKK